LAFKTTLIAPPSGGWPAGAVERFLENLERVRACTHPGVAKLRDVKQSAAGIELVHETSGRPLRELIAGLDAAAAVRVVIGVCDALAALHGGGAVHLGIGLDTVYGGGRTQLINCGARLLEGEGSAARDLADATRLAVTLLERAPPQTLVSSLRAVLAAPHASADSLSRALGTAAGLDATVAQGVPGQDDLVPEGTIVAEKYRICRHLGSGGMGHVYEAEHRILSGKRVALKVLHESLRKRTGMNERFLQEARVAAGLRHPNVVVVEDVESDARFGAVMVMELLSGTTVAERLRGGPMPHAQVALLARQALDALELAHTRGIVHRDIKPANLFLVEKDGQLSLKVLDFGIAGEGSSGTFEGTPRYASPEQLAGDAGRQSDLYSLGITLYEMLTGEYPTAGRRDELGTRLETARVPTALRTVVTRACRDDRAARFTSAAEMRALLPAPRDRRRVSLAMGAALTVLALGGGIFFATRKPPAARPTASLGQACDLFARALAANQLPDGSFPALAYNRSTGGETAQVLYALLTAQAHCHAPEPSVALRGLAALETMRSPKGWNWQSLGEHRLYDSPTANAWAVLALAEADRADRLGTLRPRLRQARDLLVAAQLPDGGFPQSQGGDSLVEASLYATVLGLYALVESEAVDATPAATTARQKATAWVQASLRSAAPDSLRSVAGLEEQAAFVLWRARTLLGVREPSDEALANTFAKDLLSRCALTDGNCRPALQRNGKLMVQTRKDHPADLLVMFWHPWARQAAATLRDDPLLPSSTRTQLGEVVESLDRDLLASPQAIAQKDAFELAEYVISTALSVRDSR
jgi:serine/threonine protein kinase